MINVIMIMEWFSISFLMLIHQQFLSYTLVIVCYNTMINNIYNFWQWNKLQCAPRVDNLGSSSSFFYLCLSLFLVVLMNVFVLIQKNQKIKTDWKTTTKAGYARKQKLVAAIRHRRIKNWRSEGDIIHNIWFVHFFCLSKRNEPKKKTPTKPTVNFLLKSHSVEFNVALFVLLFVFVFILVVLMNA